MNMQNKYYRKPLILVVDDVAKNIQVIGNLLVEQGYEISVAINGEQAIETAKLTKPDLVLMDIMMPGIDGYKTCELFKSDEELNDIPIIFLSAKSDIEDVVKGFALGGVDYIFKPFNKSEVIARIENHLELKFSKELIIENNKRVNDLKEKMDRELFIASDYFKSLLPTEMNNEFMKVNWKYIPTLQLGGDAFGYYFLNDHFIFYLFDVCGHGIASALYSINVLSNLKNRYLPDTDFTNPESVFNSLNKFYQMNEHHGFYFTIWYGAYNTKTRELSYAAAGHHPAILFDDADNLELINSPNFIIGGKKDYSFVSDSITLNKDSDLYVFSDGTFEFKLSNGDNWSIKDLSKFLEARKNIEADELNEVYKFAISNNQEEIQKDDFSILKLHFY